jgi:hypothetical protein
MMMNLVSNDVEIYDGCNGSKIVNVGDNKTKIANDEISKFQKVAMIKDEDQ